MREFGNRFKFEKLEVWRMAVEWGEEIHSLAFEFPKSEMFSLSSQMRRTVDSVALNVSEGSILQSNAEQKKFVGYATRSVSEVVTCLYKSIFRNYVNEEVFQSNYLKGYELMNELIAFRNNIK